MDESGVGKQEGQEEFQTQLVGGVLLGGNQSQLTPWMEEGHSGRSSMKSSLSLLPVGAAATEHWRAHFPGS